MDRTLSLEGKGFSPGVREAICMLDAEVPFERGSVLLGRIGAIRLDKEEGRQLAEGMGNRLEGQALEEIENVWQTKKPVWQSLFSMCSSLDSGCESAAVRHQISAHKAKLAVAPSFPFWISAPG